MLKEASLAANDFREGRFCNVVGEQSRLIEVILSLVAIATKDGLIMLTWFSIATVTVLEQLNRDTLCQISMLRSFTEPEEVEVAAVPDG